MKKQRSSQVDMNNDPHNIEISSTGFGYVPTQTDEEKKDMDQKEKNDQ